MNLPNPVSGSSSVSPGVPVGSPYVPPLALNDEQTAKAFIVIQSAIRGHTARKKFADTSFNRLIAQLRTDTKDLVKNYIQVSGRIEDSWRRGMMGKQKQNNAIEMLEKMRSLLSVLKLEVDVKNFTINSMNKAEVNEFKTTYQDRLTGYKENLRTVCENVGFQSIKKGLSVIYGKDWRDMFSNEALDALYTSDLLFTPTGYTICKIETDPGELVARLTDTKGHKESQGVRAIEKGNPFFREFRFFTPITGIDHIQGAELNIPIKFKGGEKVMLVMKGYFKNDPANFIDHLEIIRIKRQGVESEFKKNESIPKSFQAEYLKQLSTKELILKTAEAIAEDLAADWKFLQGVESRLLPAFLKEFKDSSFQRQIKLFCLLAMQEDPKLAVLLFDLMLKDIPLYVETLRNTMHYSLWRKLDLAIDEFEETKDKLRTIKEDKITLENRIATSKMDDAAKQKAFEKLKAMKSGSGESEKAEKYINGLLKIPFGVYTPTPVTSESPPEEIQKYLKKVADDLEASVHGHEKAKEAVLDWIAMRVSNNSSKGECLALEGPPGNGKTTFAKQGIAKALGRPFVFISMGGQTDSAYLIGHGFTYVGSDWGRIVEILRETQCMDPVIYIDEIDKISQTEKGKELIGVLTALTDFSQNNEFQDKYFTGIKFDLSRALFIFSYNNPSMLDRVFMDRLKIIKTEALSQKDKLAVTRKHLLPEIKKSCGFKEHDITIDDPEIKYIIDNYTIEAGARKLKEHLFAIIRGVNRRRLTDPETIKLPYHIDQSSIHRFRDHPKVEFNSIANRPMIGMVNGLYATDIGIGGLLNIQVEKAPANERMALTLTGSLKKVIKESMIVARSVAWNLVSDEVREKIYRETPPQGLHIHAPEGATPKDGPSAGGAITTAIISQLTGIPIRNDVAMTGEIDLIGRITKIGGLAAKLHGAKRAGAKLVLAPKENEKDLEKIKVKFPELLDDNFKVILVESIHDVLDNALVHNPIPRRPGFATIALKPPSDTII